MGHELLSLTNAVMWYLYTSSERCLSLRRINSFDTFSWAQWPVRHGNDWEGLRVSPLLTATQQPFHFKAFYIFVKTHLRLQNSFILLFYSCFFLFTHNNTNLQDGSWSTSLIYIIYYIQVVKKQPQQLSDELKNLLLLLEDCERKFIGSLVHMNYTSDKLNHKHTAVPLEIYNLIIIFLPFLSPSKTSNIFLPIMLLIHGLFLPNCYCMHIYFQIKSVQFYNFACMYVFSVGHLTLENQLGKIISLIISNRWPKSILKESLLLYEVTLKWVRLTPKNKSNTQWYSMRSSQPFLIYNFFSSTISSSKIYFALYNKNWILLFISLSQISWYLMI